PSMRPIASSVAAYTSTGTSLSARIWATSCSTRWRFCASTVTDMSNTDATPAGSETEGPSRALRVVVADDNALLREGIASLLVEAGHEVVGRAVDADDLRLKVRSYTPRSEERRVGKEGR